jgi:hypothetical protein
MKYPETAPAAAETIAVVHTLRSLLMESSNFVSPAQRPMPKPPPAPATVHTTVLLEELLLGA